MNCAIRLLVVLLAVACGCSDDGTSTPVENPAEDAGEPEIKDAGVPDVVVVVMADAAKVKDDDEQSAE
jgi:hypothetical protein